MPPDRMQQIQEFLIVWHLAVALALALGASYSAFRTSSLQRDVLPTRRWSDFYLVTFGRTTRRALWLGFVVPILLILIVVLVVWESPFDIPKATFALIGASIWPAIAVGAKRCHDRDRSGWFLLIFLIPVLGPLWLLIELGFFRGTVGPNRFGPDQLTSN